MADKGASPIHVLHPQKAGIQDSEPQPWNSRMRTAMTADWGTERPYSAGLASGGGRAGGGACAAVCAAAARFSTMATATIEPS